LAGLLSAAAAAVVVGFAGAAHAAPSYSVPDANQELGMYGDPAAAARYWEKQHDQNCGEMAVAMVVGQVTHHAPTEQQIDAVAESTPSPSHPGPIWHPGAATATADLPALLAHYRIQSTWVHTTSALEQNLAEGHGAIAFVDGAVLYNPNGKPNHPGHFVAVTGIDTKHGVVHLNDSVYKGPNEQVSIATFERAWSEGSWALVTK
jgi:hypothetical protein